MRSSLILAAHNEGDLLWRTIESCVQTSAGLQFEIIVADDASWDGSIDEARKRFPQLRVVQQDERTGASPTKDLGARHARGEVLVFLDSHTKPEMGALERLVEDVERLNGAAIVTPAIARLDARRWKTERGHLGYGYALQLDTLDCRWLPLNGMREHPHRGRLFYESPALIGCAFAIHRDLYDDLRGFDPHMLCWGAEDLDLGLKAWLMGHPVLHDPHAIIGHRFQSRFENFQVPVEQLVANQLRLARKNFTDAVWAEWAERCRERHPGTLADHVEGVWARAWNLFSELRASVEQERSYLLGRRVHDEFWYADRFHLPWPKLQSGDLPAPPSTFRSFAAEPEPSPSDFSHYLDAIDDKFSVDSSGIATGNVITAENADDDEGHDTYDGIPIVDTSSFTTTLLQAPQHGSVTLDLHGQFTYTADEGFSGTDSFTYQLLGPGAETDQATVNILSADSTDHEPKFPGDYSVDVPEDTPVDSIIITVQATDPDGDSLAYSLIGGNDDGTFAIHETTGVITLVQPLDYETKKIYTLTVKAMDTSGLSGTANVEVDVTDVNEPPVVPPMTYSVDDGAQAETFVGTITAFDPDGEPITTYSILEQKGIDGGNVEHAIGSYFRIEKDPDTDDAYIYVAEGITIDYDAYHSFRLKIQAYVIGGQSDDEWSTINILAPEEELLDAMDDLIDVDDRDETTGTYQGDVKENDTLGGTPVGPAGTVTLVDNTRHGSVSLNPDGTFEYAPNQGYVGEDSFAYRLSYDGQADEAVVIIDVAPFNRRPLIADQVFRVSSGFRGVLGQIAASDPDPGQTLTYSLDASTPNADWFEIDSAKNLKTAGNGAITVSSSMTIPLLVTVTDNGNPQLAASAIISVQILKGPVDISLKSVNFQDNYPIAPDPGSGSAYYPSVEFDTDAAATEESIPIWYKAGDTVRATVTFAASSDVRRQIMVRPKWPAANVHDAQRLTVDAGSSMVSHSFSLVLNSSKVNYVPHFDIAFEVSFDDANTWTWIGTSRNVLYVSKDFGSASSLAFPYRTVLHIATKYAAGATTAQEAFDGIWGYFASREVTKWNNPLLTYDHTNTSWDSVQELLANSQATCVGWSKLLLAVFDIHGLNGVVGASRQSIWAKKYSIFVVERPDLVIKNVGFGVPKTYPDAPAGFAYEWSDDNIDSNVSGLPAQNKKTPLKLFNMHSVVQLSDGRIYDPAYGEIFSSLLNWEDTALAGIGVERTVNGAPTEYVRKRVEGDEMTYFGILQ